MVSHIVTLISHPAVEWIQQTISITFLSESLRKMCGPRKWFVEAIHISRTKTLFQWFPWNGNKVMKGKRLMLGVRLNRYLYLYHMWLIASWFRGTNQLPGAFKTGGWCWPTACNQVRERWSLNACGCYVSLELRCRALYRMHRQYSTWHFFLKLYHNTYLMISSYNATDTNMAVFCNKALFAGFEHPTDWFVPQGSSTERSRTPRVRSGAFPWSNVLLQGFGATTPGALAGTFCWAWQAEEDLSGISGSTQSIGKDEFLELPEGTLPETNIAPEIEWLEY